jgi:hypothetical protein
MKISESHDGCRRHLDLVQRALTEAERITEVARILVVEHGRLVPEMRAYAEAIPCEILDPPPNESRSFVSDGRSAALKMVAPSPANANGRTRIVVSSDEPGPATGA